MKQRKRWAIFGYVTVARAACTRHFQPVVRKKKKKKLKLSLPVLPVELQKMKDTVRVNVRTFQRVQKFCDSSFILVLEF